MKARNKRTGEIKELCYGLFRDEDGNLVYRLGEKKDCVYFDVEELRWRNKDESKD